MAVRFGFSGLQRDTASKRDRSRYWGSSAALGPSCNSGWTLLRAASVRSRAPRWTLQGKPMKPAYVRTLLPVGSRNPTGV